MILKFFRRKSEPDAQLEQGLEKTRRGVFLEITRLFERGALDDDLYEELEMLLIQADVGWDVSQKLVGDLKARVRRILDPVAIDPRPQFADEALADVPADVGLDQEHLEVVVELVVDGGAVEEAGDLAEDAAAGFLQALLEFDVGLGAAAEEAVEDQRVLL